jgi:hypothetical protein
LKSSWITGRFLRTGEHQKLHQQKEDDGCRGCGHADFFPLVEFDGHGALKVQL